MQGQKLNQLKERLEIEAVELRESLQQSDEVAPVPGDGSLGRLARMDAIQSQQMARALKQRQQQKLMRVEKALSAIENGTYGRCRRCGGPISMERLEAQPDAVVCLQCASQ